MHSRPDVLPLATFFGDMTLSPMLATMKLTAGAGEEFAC